jgi:hypothetical protein
MTIIELKRRLALFESIGQSVPVPPEVLRKLIKKAEK